MESVTLYTARSIVDGSDSQFCSALEMRAPWFMCLTRDRKSGLVDWNRSVGGVGDDRRWTGGRLDGGGRCCDPHLPPRPPRVPAARSWVDVGAPGPLPWVAGVVEWWSHSPGFRNLISDHGSQSVVSRKEDVAGRRVCHGPHDRGPVSYLLGDETVDTA